VALIDRPLATPLSDAGQPDEALAKSGRGAGLH
jgi:hypothetical protein